MREYLCIATLLVMILLLIPGCGPSEADAAEARETRMLTFTVVNRSGGDVSQIGIAGASMPMNCRDLRDGQSSSPLKNRKLALPETLTLHWSNHRGERKEHTVNLWGELSAGYSGPVTLTIHPRNKVVLNGG